MSRKASREEIRAAYMSIVNTNHPDRNSSSEALEVFRNATYAYKTLVRDDRGLLISAETFINSIGEVGEEVLMPLATEVALPLLNMTVRGIGGAAKPLVEDLGDITKAVVGAALVDPVSSTEEKNGAKGALNRIFDAYKMTSYKQNVNRLNQNLDRTQRRIAETLDELQKANEINVNLKNTLNRLSDGLQKRNITANMALNKFLRDNEEYTESKRQLSVTQLNLKEVESKSQEAEKEVENINLSIANASSRIKELEIALQEEKKKWYDYKSKKATLDTTARECRENEANVKKQYEKAVTIADKCQAAMDESKRLEVDAERKLISDMKSLTKAQEESSRQIEFISIIERKLRQLQEKKNTLQNLLKESTDSS